MIIRYPTIAALADAFEQLGCLRLGHGDNWFNSEDTPTSLRKCRFGDTSLVPQAEAALAQLDQQIETPRRSWDRSPAGAFCVVPDVLAGLPTPMRRQVYMQDERAPITILVDVGSSAAVSSETLKLRGITILALVMALSRIRPVTLYQLDVASGRKDGESILITPINTTPLDLATACYVLTSSGFSRGIVMPVEERINGHSGGWPKEFNYFGDSLIYYRKRLPLLGFEEKQTLIVPAAKANDELIKQPLVWIKRQIERFTAEQQAEDLVS